jgi:hypothetical protein
MSSVPEVILENEEQKESEKSNQKQWTGVKFKKSRNKPA